MAEDDNPLDTCGNIYLDGDRFAQLKSAQNEAAKVVIGAHEGWLEGITDWPAYKIRYVPALFDSFRLCCGLPLFCS